MKTILTVKHANGEQEVVCPKCKKVMTFRPGGYVDCTDILGEYDQQEIPDCWHCKSCGEIIGA